MQYTDEDLLRIVREERMRSIGFGEGDGGDLASARSRSMAYAKGEVNDLKTLPNRSAVVDTTVADAIETVMPDLMEVFFGGEDVASFVPLSEDDEEAAQQEGDYVHHVITTENEGFLNLYTAIKDSLVTRTGVLHWWWEETERLENFRQGVPADLAPMAAQLAQAETQEGEDGTFDLIRRKLCGKVCIRAFPSEDFTVAQDTVVLRDATYCAVRDRPRVQDLISRGIDPEAARALPPYGGQEAISQERDRSGEGQMTQSAHGDLRTVEVRAHFIRLDTNDNGQLELWRVITDAEERVLLEKEQVDDIPFAALAPYLNPHRFYGESVADKLIEVQRIKTVLLRSHLDSIYFALNRRNEVAMTRANEFTLQDLLRNEPGMPVRSQTGDAVRAINDGGFNADIMGSLEYAATMTEARSGIVRNAQGLNPDTLHDTARGAMALISAAQKRVRMIARVFAETGVKDLYIGVHRMLRTHYTEKHEPATAKIGKSWASLQPHAWPERCAMAIHVGVGAAGRDHDMAISSQRLELMERVMGLQGGAQGPFLDPSNVHNALTAWERAAGQKLAAKFWTDPETAPPQEPQPDPEVAKAEAELALKQKSAEADMMLRHQDNQARAQADEAKDQRSHEREIARMQTEGELKRYQVDQELELKRQTTAAELEMKRELLTAELAMKRETAMMNAAVAHETGMAKVEASGSVSDVEPGGEPG